MYVCNKSTSHQTKEVFEPYTGQTVVTSDIFVSPLHTVKNIHSLYLRIFCGDFAYFNGTTMWARTSLFRRSIYGCKRTCRQYVGLYVTGSVKIWKTRQYRFKRSVQNDALFKCTKNHVNWFRRFEDVHGQSDIAGPRFRPTLYMGSVTVQRRATLATRCLYTESSSRPRLHLVWIVPSSVGRPHFCRRRHLLTAVKLTSLTLTRLPPPPPPARCQGEGLPYVTTVA